METILTKEEIFKKLSFGNLIYAKRASDTSEIEEGHKVGPFLVIGRKDEYLVCLYCTSKNNDSLIKLSDDNYCLRKETYITSSVQLISIDEFISLMYLLKEREQRNLFKSIYIKGLVKKFKSYIDIEEPPLEIGDVVKIDKNKYLIIGETADEYLTIKAKYSKGRYDLNPNSKKSLSKKSKYKRIGFLLDIELKKTIDWISEVNNPPLRVGNLIISDKLLYYLYYELGDKKLAFLVKRNSTPFTQEVTISSEKYYINFNSKREFEKGYTNVCLVATATKEENENIKKLRRRVRANTYY